METQRVQMKMVLPWLVSSACRAGTRDLCSALLNALVDPVQNIDFVTEQYFHSCVPTRPASWAGSYAGSHIRRAAQNILRSLILHIETWEDRNDRFCRKLQKINMYTCTAQKDMLVPLKEMSQRHLKSPERNTILWC
jgi:hypothetical protein